MIFPNKKIVYKNHVVLLQMNQLKRFLQGDIDWVDPSIITKLKNYTSVKIGSTMYQTADIIEKIKKQ